MRKKIILISIIVVAAISIYSFGGDKSDDGRTEKASSKSSISKKDLKLEEEEEERLKDFVMPAIDIVSQVNDVARGVLRKDTEPDTAISIYSSAGNFLTKKKLELSDLKTPTDDMVITKDRVLALIDDCISELDLLTDVTKSNDAAMVEGSIAVFTEKIEELRSIAGIEDVQEESID